MSDQFVDHIALCDHSELQRLRPEDPYCSCIECPHSRTFANKYWKELDKGVITQDMVGWSIVKEYPDEAMACDCEPCACTACHLNGPESKGFCYHPSDRDPVKSAP